MDDLSQSHAAKLAGITTRRLRQLEQEGHGPPRVAGRYPSEAFGRWLRDRALAEALSGLPVGDRGEVAARLLRSRAELAELDVGERKGSLMRSADAHRDWIAMAIACRERLLQVGPQTAPQLTGKSIGEAGRLITAGIVVALNELNAAGWGLPDA